MSVVARMDDWPLNQQAIKIDIWERGRQNPFILQMVLPHDDADYLRKFGNAQSFCVFQRETRNYRSI